MEQEEKLESDFLENMDIYRMKRGQDSSKAVREKTEKCAAGFGGGSFPDS